MCNNEQGYYQGSDVSPEATKQGEFKEFCRYCGDPALVTVIDSQAKAIAELVEAMEWMLKDYKGIVEEGFPPSANGQLRVDVAEQALRSNNDR